MPYINICILPCHATHDDSMMFSICKPNANQTPYFTILHNLLRQ